MPLVRAEVGDLDEIMGCFPHLKKEKEEEEGGWDGMDSSEQTLVVDVLVGTGFAKWPGRVIRCTSAHVSTLRGRAR